jgi:Ni2+-binding GTPase involved in maturation of urease and hydrogenase
MSTTGPECGTDSTSPARALARARYIVIGGFLGAGKTTAVLRLAQWLASRGAKVGLISNDQAGGLVDTALMAAKGFPVEEIAGGCFCCRFNSLVEASQRLAQGVKPDVFIAEPVGSCTDLVATVTYPLRSLYGSNFTIAPFSAMVDSCRALRVLGLEPGGKFSDKVLYIYRKQLEEADAIIINKCDLLSPERLAGLRAAVASAFPHARRFEVSARHGAGLEPWFSWLVTAEQKLRNAIQVDYEVYADGEARLGWLNGTLNVKAVAPFNVNALLEKLAAKVQTSLSSLGVEVAHFKMTFDPHTPFGDIAALSLVSNDFVPELTLTLPEPANQGELTINLRAESEPAELRRIVETTVQLVINSVPGQSATWQNLEAFKPGKPQPTHRLTLTTSQEANR